MTNFDKERILLSRGYKLICGIDEVGLGTCAGPICLAAVCFPQDVITKDFLYGLIKDSKKYTTHDKRTYAAHMVKQFATFAVTHYMDVRTINEKGLSYCMTSGIEQLIRKLPVNPDYLLIDGLNRRSELTQPADYIVKGDDLSISIAAASVIAKVERDNYMIKLAEEYPKYSFEKHKGYCTQLHTEALRSYGLTEHHRVMSSNTLLRRNR